MGRQRTTRTVPRRTEPGQPKQPLHPVAVTREWLQQLLGGIIIEHLTRQRVRDLATDVVVPDTPGVAIAQRSLSDLRRGPRADPRQGTQRLVRVTGETSRCNDRLACAADRTTWARRCSTPARNSSQLGTASHCSADNGSRIPAAGCPSGSGTGSANRSATSRCARKASRLVTTCSSAAGARASSSWLVRPSRSQANRRCAWATIGWRAGSKPSSWSSAPNSRGACSANHSRPGPQHSTIRSSPAVVQRCSPGPYGVRVARHQTPASRRKHGSPVPRQCGPKATSSSRARPGKARLSDRCHCRESTGQNAEDDSRPMPMTRSQL